MSDTLTPNSPSMDKFEAAMSCEPFIDSNFDLQYELAARSLFIFDYDGTLAPISNDPEDVVLPPKIAEALKILLEKEGNSVWIISGRKIPYLERVFREAGGFSEVFSNLGIVAEHGSFVHWPARFNSTEGFTSDRGFLSLFPGKVPSNGSSETDFVPPVQASRSFTGSPVSLRTSNSVDRFVLSDPPASRPKEGKSKTLNRLLYRREYEAPPSPVSHNISLSSESLASFKSALSSQSLTSKIKREPYEILWQELPGLKPFTSKDGGRKDFLDWRRKAFAIFHHAIIVNPKSYIEEKWVSIVWDWRGEDDHEGCRNIVRQLAEPLDRLKEEFNLEIIQGKTNVELRPASCGKAYGLSKVIVEERKYWKELNKQATIDKASEKEAVVEPKLQGEPKVIYAAFGDDATDEDMFRLLAGSKSDKTRRNHSSGVFTVKVGYEKNTITKAQYFVEDPAALADCLEKIASGKDLVPVPDSKNEKEPEGTDGGSLNPTVEDDTDLGGMAGLSLESGPFNC